MTFFSSHKNILNVKIGLLANHLIQMFRRMIFVSNQNYFISIMFSFLSVIRIHKLVFCVLYTRPSIQYKAKSSQSTWIFLYNKVEAVLCLCIH